jgi:sialidase-1
MKIRPSIRKTSESQLVRIDGDDYKALRIYSRNLSNYIAYSDSTDGGITWTRFRADKALKGTKNCMVSLIDTKRKIDGKQVILCSQGGNIKKRADGILRVGLVEKDGEVNWISKYQLNKGFFGYSCLTELSDGNFAVYYEDEPAHITFASL